MDLIVTRAPGSDISQGLLRFGGRSWPCLLGKNGITTRKREGDLKTPAGAFRLCSALYRSDRVRFPTSSLPARSIRKNDGWCDASSDPNYNRPVTLPYPASCEIMARKDHLYDLVVVMDYNFSMRVNNRGSAVFFHLIDGKDYTAGCVAVEKPVMMFLLPRLTSDTRMVIQP